MDIDLVNALLDAGTFAAKEIVIDWPTRTENLTSHLKISCPNMHKAFSHQDIKDVRISRPAEILTSQVINPHVYCLLFLSTDS